MSRHSFYCPHCFNLIKASNLIYRDSKCGYEVVRKPSFLEKMGLASAPKAIPCPNHATHNRPDQCKKCSKMITQRICPECKSPLPTAIDDLSDLTIAIIGAKGAGKSHYMALLIQRITQLYKTFDWTLQALTEDTMKNYREKFYNPLFFKGTAIDSTNKQETPKPLMYSLRFRKTGRRIMLVFFDAAGEHFDSADTMSSINRYIYNAAGIICLMDPLQLPLVRGELVDTHLMEPDMLPDQGSDTGTIINRLSELIHNGYSTKGKTLGEKAIPVPLAVAFSKIDALKTPVPDRANLLFEQDNDIYQDSQHQGFVDERQLTTISSCMEDWLAYADPGMDILNQCQAYKHHSFFGFSALGAPPERGMKLSCTPRPIRVEDPFLWILAQNGLIETKK